MTPKEFYLKYLILFSFQKPPFRSTRKYNEKSMLVLVLFQKLVGKKPSGLSESVEKTLSYVYFFFGVV